MNVPPGLKHFSHLVKNYLISELFKGVGVTSLQADSETVDTHFIVDMQLTSDAQLIVDMQPASVYDGVCILHGIVSLGRGGDIHSVVSDHLPWLVLTLNKPYR